MTPPPRPTPKRGLHDPPPALRRRVPSARPPSGGRRVAVHSHDRAAAEQHDGPETVKAESFVVAPGGERQSKKSETNDLDDIEKRLHNLRGFRS
ncbi:unnamed protein product [Colias eurytheme]|nr:unnamed protein product [Colias eurytheme]